MWFIAKMCQDKVYYLQKIEDDFYFTATWVENMDKAMVFYSNTGVYQYMKANIPSHSEVFVVYEEDEEEGFII